VFKAPIHRAVIDFGHFIGLAKDNLFAAFDISFEAGDHKIVDQTPDLEAFLIQSLEVIFDLKLEQSYFQYNASSSYVYLKWDIILTA